MATAADDFTLDTDDLDEMVVRLEKSEVALHQLMTDLDKQMAVLLETWEGLSATAQRAAHQEWSTGMNAMRAAMAELRAAARLAHGNYTGAAQANLAMWEKLR